jgi:phospholipid/cholesterol/gamma-HCH transport system ATP-binding protein
MTATEPTNAERPAPAEREDVVVEVSDFSAAYGGRTVLHDVTFRVRRGEVVVIAGDSGSGKSTVLKHLIGLNRPAKGVVRIDGDDLWAATGRDRDRILRKFGVSFQSGALFGSMTVLDNVKLPLAEFARVTGRRADAIALASLQLVGLADSAQKLPAELSGGMQKRAAIARAIVLDPMIVFMDEPSAGLDPITSADLDAVILSLNRLLGMTFVIVSHELASIMTVADRVLLFSGARHTLVAQGDPRELGRASDDPWVRAFFNRTASADAGGNGRGDGSGKGSGKVTS